MLSIMTESDHCAWTSLESSANLRYGARLSIIETGTEYFVLQTKTGNKKAPEELQFH